MKNTYCLKVSYMYFCRLTLNINLYMRKFKLILFALVLLIFVMKSNAQNCGGVNVISNPGFETGTTGWVESDFTLTAVNSPVYSGSYSCLVSNRDDPSSGIEKNMMGLIQSDKLYCFSSYVRLQNVPRCIISATLKVVDNDGTWYCKIAETEIYNDRWVELSSDGFSVKFNGNPTQLKIYIETYSGVVDPYYIDDISWSELDTVSNWRDSTDKYINLYRKRDLTINVTDGINPIQGATVRIKQVKSDFPFGSCFGTPGLSNNNYKNFFKDNFNYCVAESSNKWTSNEVNQGVVTYANADNIYNFCLQNDIEMRGHCLFWESEDNIQNWVKALSIPNLKIALNNRIESALGHYQGQFSNWDVNNEMLTHFYYRDLLGDTIRPWFFKRAKEVDPNVSLFVNDYNILTPEQNRCEYYRMHIEDLIAQGAPIDAIGCQSHFWESDVHYDAIILKLNRLAQLGLPIWITEFDVSEPDVNKRANKLEMFYRTAFSHPSVEGIFMWGFWDGLHWMDDAAIVNLDWTVNAAGLMYQALRTEWTTDETKITNQFGSADFRGFHGEYEITITMDNCTVINDVFTLHSDSTELILNYLLDCTITSVEDNSQEYSIVISPNPITDNFFIEINGQQIFDDAKIEIYDIQGENVKTVMLENHKTTINLEQMPAGVYMYKITNGGEIIENGKLIVQ